MNWRVEHDRYASLWRLAREIFAFFGGLGLMAHQALSGDPSPYLLTAALAMMGLPAASYAGDLLQRKASELNKKEKRDPR